MFSKSSSTGKGIAKKSSFPVLLTQNTIVPSDLAVLLRDLRQQNQTWHNPPRMKHLFKIVATTKSGRKLDFVTPDWKLDFWKEKFNQHPLVCSYRVEMVY